MKENLSRRDCQSITARIFDPLGKQTPLTAKLKFDLRRVVRLDPDWDRPIAPELRLAWIDNFKLIELARQVDYVRCPIPSNAVNPKEMRLWIFSDHSEVVVLSAYATYQLKEGGYSVAHLLGRSMLPPEGWTTPMGELHGISASANLKIMLENALDGWVKETLVGSDSEIALMWIKHESLELEVFQ